MEPPCLGRKHSRAGVELRAHAEAEWERAREQRFGNDDLDPEYAAMRLFHMLNAGHFHQARTWIGSVLNATQSAGAAERRSVDIVMAVNDIDAEEEARDLLGPDDADEVRHFVEQVERVKTAIQRLVLGALLKLQGQRPPSRKAKGAGTMDVSTSEALDAQKRLPLDVASLVILVFGLRKEIGENGLRSRASDSLQDDPRNAKKVAQYLLDLGLLDDDGEGPAFETWEVLDLLVQQRRLQIAEEFAQGSRGRRFQYVRALEKHNQWRMAMKNIHEYNFDPEDFPRARYLYNRSMIKAFVNKQAEEALLDFIETDPRLGLAACEYCMHYHGESDPFTVRLVRQLGLGSLFPTVRPARADRKGLNGASGRDGRGGTKASQTSDAMAGTARYGAGGGARGKGDVDTQTGKAGSMKRNGAAGPGKTAATGASQEAAVAKSPPLKPADIGLDCAKDVVLVTTLRGLKEARKVLRRAETVGIDCEWRPRFLRGDRETPVALIQLSYEKPASAAASATGSSAAMGVFLLDATAMTSASKVAAGELRDSCSDLLEELFADAKVSKISFDPTEDLRKLRKAYPKLEGIEMSNFVDLQKEVARTRKGGKHGLSLSKVSEMFLKKPLAKGQQMTNWSARPLTPAQIQYAAVDAACLIPIHRAFEEEKARGEKGSRMG